MQYVFTAYHVDCTHITCVLCISFYVSRVHTTQTQHPPTHTQHNTVCMYMSFTSAVLICNTYRGMYYFSSCILWYVLGLIEFYPIINVMRCLFYISNVHWHRNCLKSRRLRKISSFEVHLKIRLREFRTSILICSMFTVVHIRVGYVCILARFQNEFSKVYCF